VFKPVSDNRLPLSENRLTGRRVISGPHCDADFCDAGSRPVHAVVHCLNRAQRGSRPPGSDSFEVFGGMSDTEALKKERSEHGDWVVVLTRWTEAACSESAGSGWYGRCRCVVRKV
jgi:hypothetical protein